MINSITIQNYLSHKDTSLSLSDGLNVIVGQSDSGKSAILGAINWVINNKPSGEEYKSWWAKKGRTSVCLNLSEELLVRRIRAKDDNLYSITNVEGGEDNFRAFGQDVPREVKELLNFGDLNIQYQLDRPFLLSESPGEVARYINQLVNLDIIDTSLSNITRVKREAETDLKYAENHLSTLQEELDQFDDLDKAEKALVEIEVLAKEANEVRHTLPIIERLVRDIVLLEEKIKEASEIGKVEKSLNSLIDEYKELETKKDKQNRLEILVRHIDILERKIKQKDEILKADTLIDSLIQLEKESEILYSEFAVLKRVVKSIEGLTIKVKREESELKKLEKELKDLMPDMCPILDIPCEELRKNERRI